jgi:hypothetical protein
MLMYPRHALFAAAVDCRITRPSPFSFRASNSAVPHHGLAVSAALKPGIVATL